eukprot:scaffold268873_cov33-Prasinocladus_malaysianus.AAC.1
MVYPHAAAQLPLDDPCCKSFGRNPRIESRLSRETRMNAMLTDCGRPPGWPVEVNPVLQRTCYHWLAVVAAVNGLLAQGEIAFA